MNEDTLIKTMPLPNGRDWEFYADANVLVLAPHLCPEEREKALSDLQVQWRRSGMRIVGAVTTAALAIGAAAATVVTDPLAAHLLSLG